MNALHEHVGRGHDQRAGIGRPRRRIIADSQPFAERIQMADQGRDQLELADAALWATHCVTPRRAAAALTASSNTAVARPGSGAKVMALMTATTSAPASTARPAF